MDFSGGLLSSRDGPESAQLGTVNRWTRYCADAAWFPHLAPAIWIVLEIIVLETGGSQRGWVQSIGVPEMRLVVSGRQMWMRDEVCGAVGLQVGQPAARRVVRGRGTRHAAHAAHAGHTATVGC